MTTPEHRAPEGGRPVSEMQERIAVAISGAPFPTANSLRKALAAMKATISYCDEARDEWGSEHGEFEDVLRAEISIAEGGKDGA